MTEYAAPAQRPKEQGVVKPAGRDIDQVPAVDTRAPEKPCMDFDFAAIPVHVRAAPHRCEVEPDARQAAAVRAALASPGAPLEPPVRHEMERMVGLDLSELRIHTSGLAQRSARELDARAYSVGWNIVFGTGEYAPLSREGRRLLAHELWHVRDSHAGPVQVLRQPTGTSVTAPTPDDQREFVTESITFRRGAAEFYSFRTAPSRDQPSQEAGGVRVRVEQLAAQLAGYLRIRDTAANLIDTALNGDAALLDQLRTVYRDAVTALLDAAARESRRRNTDAATGDSPYELFQRHKQVIHEWAWPRATPDPRANVLLEQVPEAERGQIRVEAAYDLPPATMDGYFHPRALAVPPPADTTVVVAPGGPARIRAGLTRVAAMLATTAPTPLPVNTTTTVALDLGRYGGDRALYRFTYLQHAAPRGREILVERLGSMAPDQRPPSEQAVPADVFARHGFVRASGTPGTSINWPDDQFALLQSAVAQIPESILGSVRELTFVRVAGANPDDARAGASYNIDDHAIRVYDVAFAGASTASHATPGGRASNEFDRLIAHEIGHALDGAPRRRLLTSFRSSLAEQRRFHRTPVPGRPGRITLPPGERVGWQALQARIRRREAALVAGRSPSGARFEHDASGKLGTTEQLPAGEVNDFRDAAAADGPTRITTYSDRAVVEHFAEAFSLYITEPQTLARLRPHVYAYFAKKFPDPARPAPSPTP